MFQIFKNCINPTLKTCFCCKVIVLIITLLILSGCSSEESSNKPRLFNNQGTQGDHTLCIIDIGPINDFQIFKSLSVAVRNINYLTAPDILIMLSFIRSF